MDSKQYLIEYVKRVAREAEKFGQKVQINYNLPSISIDTGIDEYHFNEYESQEMIDNIKKSHLYPECSVEQIILWQAQSW